MANYDGSVIIQTEINTGPFDKGLRQMESEAKQFSGNLSGILKKGLAAVGLGFELEGALKWL